MSALQPSADLATECILNALSPLLSERDSSVVSRTTTAIRTAGPPPHILSNALYVFSKLVLATPGSDTLYCAVVNALVGCGVLSLQELFNACDLETQKLLQPNVDHLQEFRRASTRLFFTQTRFNLFREESEGYAKLISLMWDAVFAPSETSEETFVDALLALVGQFNLDTNRVIEVVLSAAADAINDQKLRSGPVPTDQRLPPLFAKLLDQFANDHVFSVVGAMLQSYHSVSTSGIADKAVENTLAQSAISSAGAARAPTPPRAEPESKTPASFLTLIVVLIRERRMTVSDIWSNFSPRDDEELVRQFLTYEEQVQKLTAHICSSRIGRPTSGTEKGFLARTGIGPSERDIFSQYKFVLAGPFANFTCQKLDLIFLLINMCRWDDAMEAILGLGADGEQIDIAAHPGISGALISFVDILLNPLLSRQFPGRYPNNCNITDAIAELGGRANRCPFPIRTIEELLSTAEDGPGIVVQQMLQVLGPHTRTRPGLLHALCRLLKGRKETIAVEIMQDVVLPSFSLLQSNVGLGNEIWEVLKLWSHDVRWQVYGNLHYEVPTTCAVYNAVAERAAYEMKYVLKRLTTETLKNHLPTITKISQCQSLSVFSAAIDRIQGYPPDVVTVSPVVDVCRNCSELSVDMLLFVIVDRMSDSKRSRLKEDGINIAQWYATLSLFLGLCMRKLKVTSQQIEGVLNFLYTKLVIDQEALLITTLSDLIVCTGNIEIETNLTAKQIQAQSGGRHLNAAVSGIWSRLQPDSKLVGHAFDMKLEREKRSAVVALQSAFESTKLHVPIAIAIAQLTRSVVYQEELRSMPLKLGANIVDRAKSSLLQLSQFLDTPPPNSSKSEGLHVALWKPLRNLGMDELTSRLGVPVPSAMALLSPVLNFVAKDNIQSEDCGSGNPPTEKILSNESVHKAEILKVPVKHEVAGRRESSGDAIEVNSTSEKQVISVEAMSQGNSDSVNVLGAEKLAPDDSTSVFAEIIFKKTEGYVSAEFVRAFWTLKLCDISVPVDLYDSESKQLGIIKDVWEKELERHRRNAHGDTERLRRGEAEARRIREFVEAVRKERDEAVENNLTILALLRKNSAKLCPSQRYKTDAEQDRAVNYVLQECILPRCKLSSCDAIFCSKFVLLLLQLDIPVFPYAKYFEGLLKFVPVILSSCSENEASNIARLVKEVLTTLEKWRSNRKVFDAEASNDKCNGFHLVDEVERKPMRHEQFCQWLFDIHALLSEGLCVILVSKEYLYSRNSLCVLAGIADVFPKVSEHSSRIESCVEKLCASDLPDIRLSSTGVLARLKSGRAKRLPKHIFKLKPVSGQSHVLTNGKGPKEIVRSSDNVPSKKPAEAGTQSLRKRQVAQGPKPAVTMDKPASTMKLVENSGKAANGHAGPAEKSKSAAKTTAVKQDLDEQNHLNPDAKEFTPGLCTNDSLPTNRTDAAPSALKRSRDETDADRQRMSSDTTPVMHGSTERRPPDIAPPVKRLKSGEFRTNERQLREEQHTAVSKTTKDESKRFTDDRGVEAPNTAGKAPANAVVKIDSSVDGSKPSGSADGGASTRLGSAGSGRNRQAVIRPKREDATVGKGPHDGQTRDTPAHDSRQGLHRDGGVRDPPSRDPGDLVAREPRDSRDREGLTKGAGGQGPQRRESPSSGPPKQPSERESLGRVSSAGGVKENSRRRRGADNDAGFRHRLPDDSGQSGQLAPEYDDGFTESQSLKRRRDSHASRENPPYDGDNRRTTRQRPNDGPFRERGLPRDDYPRERRFEANHSPAKEKSRFESGFSGRRSPPASGPKDPWRGKNHDIPHDTRNASGGGIGGSRRRDLDGDRSPGWKQRPNDRPEFDSRDRPMGRGREDIRRDGEYGIYDDRGGNRGGSRPYRDRRNGGRDDRGHRRRQHGRNGGGGARR